MFHVKHSMFGPAFTVSRETSAESLVVGGVNHTGLEEWAFGRNANTARVPGVAQLHLMKELATMASEPQVHPDSGHTLTIPSADTGLNLIRWLTDQQDSTDPQEWSRALGRHRRRTETASRHQVELGPVARVMPGFFGPTALDLDPIIQTEINNSLRQKRGTTLIGIKVSPSG